MSGQKRKADCTPEEWAAHLAKVRAWRSRPEVIEKQRQRQREYYARPEVKERHKAYDAKPEVAQRRSAYGKTEEAKQKAAARHLARKAKSPELHKERIAIQRQKRTGFTAEHIAQMLEHQGNRCAVCARLFGHGVRICADHCHSTQTRRGLLCLFCNTIEGMLKKMQMTPAQFAQRLADYLDEPPARKVDQSVRQVGSP